MTINRRKFIQIGSAAIGGAAVASGATTEWFGLDKSKTHKPDTDGDKVVATFCELCFWKCGVLAHVKDGKVTKITGNPDHPLSRGRLCPRGAGGTGLLYDPDRLKTPLIRVQERGEDVFREASWDEALDKIAEGMLKIKEEHGPEAMALFYHGFGGSWLKHLFKGYGTPNVTAPSYAQCRGPRDVGFETVFGEGVGSPERVDMENSDAIMLIGSHIGENMHNTQVQDFSRAIDRGAKIIVVDPRFSVAASKAAKWLPIKPGTDIALLLSIMHVLIKENLYDKEYIDNYAFGFDQLKAHVADKTPEWGYVRTGIKPEDIIETARILGGAKPATVIHPGRRVTWYGNDSQRSRSIAMVAALLGAWGRKGGYPMPTPMSVPKYPDVKPFAKHDMRPKADRPKEGDYPFSAGTVLASGVLDATIPGGSIYDIKGWFVYGTNLITTMPNRAKTLKAIEQLDFMVAVDVLPAEICGWADVVLPEATYLERWDDLHAAAYKEPYVALRQPAVEPLGESKPGWWIAKELGKRLGLEEHFPWESGEQYVTARLEAGGFDVAKAKETGVIKGEIVPVNTEDGAALDFYTDSGKIELYSPALAAAGFDPMPEHTPPMEPPAGYYRLLFGRASVHTFGRTTNNRLLGEVFDENEVWIANSVAKNFGLVTGDRVIVTNQDGIEQGPVLVKATERIRTDCVFMVHGFGHTAKKLKFAFQKGADDSKLVSNVSIDPLMGGTGMNNNFVTFRKA
jgi:thiosulfate reductase/polysulfide reductase chain A